MKQGTGNDTAWYKKYIFNNIPDKQFMKIFNECSSDDDFMTPGQNSKSIIIYKVCNVIRDFRQHSLYAIASRVFD